MPKIAPIRRAYNAKILSQTYGSIIIHLAIVAFQIREITRNSDTI